MYKIEQDFEKVSNKTLGIQIDRATKAIPETVTSGPRRTTRNVKPVFKASMANEGKIFFPSPYKVYLAYFSMYFPYLFSLCFF